MRFFLTAALAAILFCRSAGAQTWRGLTVTDEARCSAYSSSQYGYSQTLEDALVELYGGAYSPYTGKWFESDMETDIEHIVARSEAHDSGMCSASEEDKRAFAGDLLNLTLADPATNRDAKSDKDAADWLPQLNRCWFANRVVKVKQKYSLTVDTTEQSALNRVLQDCGSVDLMIFPAGAGPVSGVYVGSSGQALVVIQNRAGDTIDITLEYEVGIDSSIIPTGWSAAFARTAEAPVGFSRYFPSSEVTIIQEELATANPTTEIPPSTVQ